MRYLCSFAMALAALAVAGIAQGFAQSPERRFALVLGNAEYKAGRLPTGANDAGLVAEALRTAGFDVTGARDLDQDAIRQSFREFFGKVEAAGADAVTFVYLAGYGMQFGGDNYIVPVDADIARVDDIPIQAVRVSDLVQPLSGLPGAVKMIVIDAARQTPFAPAGPPLAQRPCDGRAGAGHARRVQRIARLDSPSRGRPLRGLRAGAHGNDRHRRA